MSAPCRTAVRPGHQLRAVSCARRAEAPRRPCPRMAAVAAPGRGVGTPFTSDEEHLVNWSPSSWKTYKALQQPEYPDKEAVKRACEEIASMPPLVFAGECRILQDHVAAAARGEGFLLFGGDCAEAFSQFSANHIRDLYRVILQMAVVLMFGGGIPVTKIGRIAGQFAKPRSADLETIDGVSLPSYRGDIINGPEFTEEARIPDPFRLVRAYHQSAATLNLLRGFSSGGYGGLDRVGSWNLDFMANSERGADYLALAARVEEALQFLQAVGINTGSQFMKETEFYTAHECLLLDYESALTREDSTTGLYYNCSAHFVWCGERTRQLDGAHIEFLRGVANPIGVKVSDKMPPQDLVSLLQTVNPNNVPGRVAVITRMGEKGMRRCLPGLIQAVQEAGQIVTWVTDPMHGNTESCGRFKTRQYENIRAEIEAFFDVHEEMGTVPGGIHLEMTGENVTECIGGGAQVTEEDLASRYHTHCDPRLNVEQSLELAFYVASRLRKIKRTRAEQAKQLDVTKRYGGAKAR